MTRLRTLRGQLTLWFAVALFIGLLVYALVAHVVIGQIRHATTDLRIETTTRALIPLVHVRNGRLVLGRPARDAFGRVIAPLLNGAIIERGGRLIASTVVDVPTNLFGFADRPPAATTLYRVTTAGQYHEQLRIAVAPIPTREHPLGVAVVWRSQPSLIDADRQLLLLSAVAIPLVLGFAILAGAAAASRGLAPLAEVGRIASEIEAHDLSRRIGPIGGRDELSALVETFDRMLDRLERAFARERRFTSDASHELRAPLSVIRAEADLMLRRPRSPDDYQRALVEIARQADRLESLTRDLLAAARGGGDAGRFALRVDLVTVAESAVAQLAPLAQQFGIHVDIVAEERGWVSGNGSNVHRAVICAIHNALKYAREGGRVVVRCTVNASVVELAIEDDGPGFSDQALEHALQRFWRDDAPRADETAVSGSGLGLAIADEIVRSCGGTLAITNAEGGGGCVRLRFMPFDGKTLPAHTAPATGRLKA